MVDALAGYESKRINIRVDGSFLFFHNCISIWILYTCISYIENMYQLQPRVKWHETSWAKAMACTKPWIVGVRVEPEYSCIIEGLKILRDSGGVFFFVKKSYFRNLENNTKQKFGKQTRLSAYTDFFLFLFYFSMISKERCGRALGWTWSKGASRRVGQMLRGCIRTTFLPPCLLIFDVTFFPLHKVFWGEKHHGFNDSIEVLHL